MMKARKINIVIKMTIHVTNMFIIGDGAVRITYFKLHQYHEKNGVYGVFRFYNPKKNHIARPIF